MQWDPIGKANLVLDHLPRAAYCLHSLKSCHSARWSRSVPVRFLHRSQLMGSSMSGVKGPSDSFIRLIESRAQRLWISLIFSFQEQAWLLSFPEAAPVTHGVQTMSASSAMATSFPGIRLLG
jgi:hypothetical protein